ncbi:putative esterase of the alpha-beta hydrolase superfamily protein [Halosimplex carlsbadense 2-9-1]|uniref:Putative esterase of the alpha-beta hydrolase superfamily protein n=1 Tax=Halosimplex carlsbadense 2-9-1 TaxID=797114 RepID=M0CEH7_9EURY|nr:patatin-like phospholipase family protein [Halosimplex carlsbadense]ELZ20289.1 putative esterase of the alpha-beta hydrolase superfamily protein [Halosimplex carlsbadense 2-9-1]
MTTEDTTVAVACQGGGSHTAFAGGALAELFEGLPADYAVEGLSGTSGGAITAAAAWDALRADGPDAVTGRVAGLWADIAADTVAERTVNDLGVWTVGLAAAGAPLPSVSPYANPAAWAGRAQLRALVETHVDFDRSVEPEGPRLFVSAVDVLAGRFRTFDERAVTPEVLLASAAAPRIFPAVDLDGVPHWDGLFARNPPIKPFLVEPDDVADKPDEIWVVRVNPGRRETEPRSERAIADRRDELAADISLTEQIDFVEQVSEWLEAEWLPRSAYKPVTVRQAVLSKPLSLASRVDRDPDLIDDLFERGRAAGAALLADLP